jgi:primosomal protein N' (replication factor Y) (superfamily II helicase)
MPIAGRFAQIVPLGARLDREMTYAVPDDLAETLAVGHRVLVPLGPRWTTGIVCGLGNDTDVENVKAVGMLLDRRPALSTSMLELCRWMAHYYLCGLSEVFKAVLPAGIHAASGQQFALAEGEPDTTAVQSETQRRVLSILSGSGPTGLRQIERRLQIDSARGALDALIRRGLVEVRQKMSDPRVKPKLERVAEMVPSDPRWMDLELPAIQRKAPKQAACLRKLWEAGGPLPTAALRADGISASVLRALAAGGLVRILSREVRRDPYGEEAAPPPDTWAPTTDQEQALAEICPGIDAGRFETFLLRGVTGSGKTLVYIRAAAHALRAGKGALILVPEIALTPQTVRRFRAEFGDQVAVLHSGLSDGERYDAWRDVRDGRRQVVVGARSAVFAPLPKPGLIVVDEEHDGSYKQTDPAPRYGARDVAVMRGMLESVPVVLGSATPSLESYQNAGTGKFRLLSLPDRIDSRSMPSVTVVDMKRESGSVFSTILRQKIKDRVQRNERVILLQNRRGYAPFVQCTECGTAASCPDCQVSFTYHANGRRLVCHYCGRTTPVPGACEACGAAQLKLFGVGTQRVEEDLVEQFDGIRVLRMDVDTTRGKGAHDRILSAFGRGEADVLLGTQMVAKGLDFPGVTLVGVISADTGIHLPDFRASERTFQLLTQVSGRAGRGDTPGEVVVQTYLPDGEAVRYAADHDFLAFAAFELENRQDVGYPPFGRMALFLLKGPQEDEVARAAARCAETLRGQTDDQVEVLGPVPAPLARIRKTYRWQVIVKAPTPARLNAAARAALSQMGRQAGRVRLDVDVDPVSML